MKEVTIEKRPNVFAKYNIVDIDEPCPRCGSLNKCFEWASYSRGHARKDCCGIEMYILDRSSDDDDSEEFKNFMNNIGRKHYIVLTKMEE